MVDLSDFDNLRDNIKNLINVIMAEDKTNVGVVVNEKHNTTHKKKSSR